MLILLKFMHRTCGIKRGFTVVFVLAALVLINVPFFADGVSPIFKLLCPMLGFGVAWFTHNSWKAWTEEQVLNELGFSLRDLQPQESPQQ